MVVRRDDQDDRRYQYHTSIPIDEEKRQRKKLERKLEHLPEQKLEHLPERKLEQKRKKGKKIVGRRDM